MILAEGQSEIRPKETNASALTSPGNRHSDLPGVAVRPFPSADRLSEIAGALRITGAYIRPWARPMSQDISAGANIDKPSAEARRPLLLFPEAVGANEEVVPVNVLTWVLLFGITVGR